MAVSINGYNVGTDVAFAITDQFGDIFMDNSLGYLEEFETQATDTLLKITPITTGGVPIFQTIWNGGTGRMTFTRFGNTFQQLFLDLMGQYHSFGLIPQFSMQQSVRNRDGSVDEYLINGFQFNTPHFGTFSGVREVKMQTQFAWSTMVASGPLTNFLAGLAQAA